MSGVLKIEIVESKAILKKLLTQQKSAKTQERVQVLYWLKTNQANSIGHLAVMLGRHPTTVSRWLSRYRKGGIEALLTIKSSPGRPTSIPPEAIAKLKEELSSPEGFSSYGEIQTWLETVCELKISYKVVHDTVRYRLKAKLKVPRPVNIKQQEGAIAGFKKKLGQQIIFHLEQHQNKIGIYEQIRYWCQDESRLGLKTMAGRKITLQGVKPIGLEDWQFEYFWIYGLVEPLSGESFFWEFCHFDSICFEKYLELFVQKFPKDLHIIQLDNGSPHRALDLDIPENIILLFQPPYSPQVNPIERFWKHLKKDLKWSLFEDLDALRNTVQKILPKLNRKIISSLTGWKFIVDAVCIAGI